MNCVKINAVTCPPDTPDYNYVIELGQCKKVEKSCAYSGNDGCIACKEGYYLSNKQCLKVQPYQGLTSQSETVENFREEDYWFWDIREKFEPYFMINIFFNFIKFIKQVK